MDRSEGVGDSGNRRVSVCRNFQVARPSSALEGGGRGVGVCAGKQIRDGKGG